jgi:hypothetical protein
MKIGYDFDGVLHKNVEEIDGLGEQNLIKDEPNLIALYGILNRIKQEITDGHEVFIISRGEKNDILANLKKLAIDIILKKENIITDLGRLNIPKSKIIKEKGIDVFFDDSVLNIHEINREKKKDNLKTQLYFVNPFLETYKRVKSNNLKILSYNLNWENMNGMDKAPIKECQTKDLCSSNINKLILNELPLDFIFLQEFANEKILLKDLDKDFNLVTTTSDKESMATLINKKYNIDTKIDGEFEKGRPFLVIFLKEKICLINIHMGHKKNVIHELKKIEDKIYSTDISVDPYRVILGGDFNADIGSEVLFCEKRMRTFPKKFTCCVYSTHMGKERDILKYMRGKNIDHILDSENEPVYGTILNPIDNFNRLMPGSDHLAIYAELLK